MANTLAELTIRLGTALRDATYTTWASTELDDLITWAVADLYPLVSRPILPSSTVGAGLAAVQLVAGTYYYSLPTGIVALSRVDLLNSGGDDLGPINGRAWEVVGDVYAGTAQIHISPYIASTVGILKLHGYGVYNVTTFPVSDAYVPLVLAMARAEAYRRLGADREKFKSWLSRNQSQNVSINELLQFVNDADSEIERLRRRMPPSNHKPVPGRQG
jgi:hypothetical protein